MFGDTRKLHLESLEKREMMAGDVRVYTSGNTLFILGDAQRNEVEVVANANGGLTVRGQIIGGAATKLNGGLSALTANNVTNLQVGLAGGDDVIRLGDASGRIAKVAGGVILDGGAGADLISVRSVQVGGDFNINTGAGVHDTVNVLSANVGGNLIIGDPLAINAGDWDEINVVSSTAKRQMQFLLRGGNDKVNITSCVADGIFADLGAGDDSFSMTYTNHGRTFDVRGGAGYDTFFVPIYRNTKYFGSGFEKVTNN